MYTGTGIRLWFARLFYFVVFVVLQEAVNSYRYLFHAVYKIYRILLTGLISAPTIRQYYSYVTDPQCKVANRIFPSKHFCQVPVYWFWTIDPHPSSVLGWKAVLQSRWWGKFLPEQQPKFLGRLRICKFVIQKFKKFKKATKTTTFSYKKFHVTVS
jgi:hypothetical protein